MSDGGSPSARPLITIIAYSAISQAALGLSYPGTPLYLLSEGLGEDRINAILCSMAIASLLGQVIWGYLSDRMLSKLAYVEIGCAGSAIGFLVLASTHDVLAFALFYVLTSFVGSAAYPAAMALLADISPTQKRGRLMGIFWSAASVGWAIAVAFTGWIIENLGGPYLFGSCALLHAASLLIVFLGFRGHGLQRGEPARIKGSRSFISTISQLSRPFFVLFLCTLVFFVLDYAKNVYVPIFYAYEVGLHATLATLLLSLTSWIEVPATILFGVLSDKIGRVKVVLTSYLLSALFMVTNMWVGGIELAIVAMGIYGLLWGAFSGATSALASELVAEENMGLAMGLFNSAASFGSILAPLIIGGLIYLSGYRSSFAAMAFLMLLFSLFFFLGVKKPGSAGDA